jgi:hypothetical protein
MMGYDFAGKRITDAVLAGPKELTIEERDVLCEEIMTDLDDLIVKVTELGDTNIALILGTLRACIIDKDRRYMIALEEVCATIAREAMAASFAKMSAKEDSEETTI